MIRDYTPWMPGKVSYGLWSEIKSQTIEKLKPLMPDASMIGTRLNESVALLNSAASIADSAIYKMMGTIGK